ncbi:uncharacterized protein UTRI_03311_B [Ustilago trichophora]|uniref:Uncharacterized protein n=1 Tax=Ustilago trichophora TaxID=86804 RepID=A0A5C3E4S7_9BASI|nr:uncharacterized protein UTRI_03311_B [Ustilago trichophora]
MVRALNLIAIVTGGLWLVSAVSSKLPDLYPHPHIDYILDAKYLWHTVTNMNVLPGLGHATNADMGVTARWKDFLRDHGKRVLDDTLDELVWHIQDVDRRPYKGVEPRFERFLNNELAILPVPNKGDQFVARSFVNAFAGHWSQRYQAEREAQVAALMREEAARHQGFRGPVRSTGTVEVMDLDRSFSGPSASSSGSNYDHEEDTGRSW